MKLTKNGRLAMLLSLLLSVLFTLFFFLIDTRAGVLAIAFSFFSVGILVFREYYALFELRRISREVERAMHKAEKLRFENYSEGDFSILINQISKMIRIVVESDDKLKADKKLLADSIADISHQIRTPLTSLNILATSLSNPELSGNAREECILKMRIQFKRIDWLVNALLKTSKLDAGTAGIEPEIISLSELISRSASSLLVPIELRGIDFRVDASGNVKADPQWTAEALGNIIKNCMEHTPPGGVIKVDAHENALFSEIVITDSGCGIDNEDLPHIFKRFYKGKNSTETSIGIGLSMSRMIIKNQGGTVSAENGKDGGAVFTVKFYKGVI